VIAKDDPELLAFLHRLLAFEADGSARVDRAVGLVLADWLEERSDGRAADVRALAAFRPPEVRFPSAEDAEQGPDDEEGDEEEDGPRRPAQPIWRWPPADHPAPPWWDLLAERSADEDSVYVRWHADPYTDAGLGILKQTGDHVGGLDCSPAEVPQAVDRCLAELIAAALGWSARALKQKQEGK
jgi:hypothetical protein